MSLINLIAENDCKHL